MFSKFSKNKVNAIYVNIFRTLLTNNSHWPPVAKKCDFGTKCNFSGRCILGFIFFKSLFNTTNPHNHTPSGVKTSKIKWVMIPKQIPINIREQILVSIALNPLIPPLVTKFISHNMKNKVKSECVCQLLWLALNNLATLYNGPFVWFVFSTTFYVYLYPYYTTPEAPWQGVWVNTCMPFEHIPVESRGSWFMTRKKSHPKGRPLTSHEPRTASH